MKESLSDKFDNTEFKKLKIFLYQSPTDSFFLYNFIP